MVLTELELYWCNEWPFTDPVKDNNIYAWWDALKLHPHAQVLAILAMKIFAILINSMLDECTGLTLTWLNSPLCASQNAQMLVNMIQIGQWYKAQIDSHGASQKAPYCPAVKCHDINSDLLQLVSLGEHKLSDAEHQPHSDAVTSFIPVESESEDGSDDEDKLTKMTSIVARLQEEVDLLVDEDISLDSALLRDFLSSEPALSSQNIPVLQKFAVMLKDTELDWDF
ncbi:hypothetical protein F5I97DRAFT_1929170 [Phlebopus sp. FC_14]|nr:hypothetical protein F5I97DRAFT_1929170 [Phlebopus sp. FC_14]